MFGLNCYWPWNGCIFDDVDGEVYFAPTSEKYKNMLTWLNLFYEEGYIDPEVFTQTAAEFNAKQDGDLTFVLVTADNPDDAGYKGRVGDKWSNPLATELNDPLITLSANYQTDIGVISKHTDYPEVCMLLLDYLFSEEASMTAYYGQEGIDYRVVDKDKFILEPVSTDWTLTSGLTPLLVSRWARDEWMQPKANAMREEHQAIVEEYGVFAWQNYLKFTAEESETINFINADLGKFCDQYFTGFITGEFDIEKDWDKYVKECESMELAELTAIYQNAYNRYFGIK